MVKDRPQCLSVWREKENLWRGRQTDKQKARQPDRQAGRHTDRHTDKHWDWRGLSLTTDQLTTTNDYFIICPACLPVWLSSCLLVCLSASPEVLFLPSAWLGPPSLLSWSPPLLLHTWMNTASLYLHCPHFHPPRFSSHPTFYHHDCLWNLICTSREAGAVCQKDRQCVRQTDSVSDRQTVYQIDRQCVR